MLSKLATLILGNIAEQDRNPYEITTMLKKLQTKKWLPMADSTVYATINNLKKKGLIEGKQEKKGGLPEKTIYSITSQGKIELHSAITFLLEEDASVSSGFDIGILLMYNLSKSDVLTKLKKKLERLENNFYTLREQTLNLERTPSHIAFTSLAILKHRIHLIEAEIKTVKELIRELNVQNNVSNLSPFDMRMT